MELDEEKIDRAVLALLYLGLHEQDHAWKGFDWDAMNRLHEKGFISDPVRKAKSVLFSEEGKREARRATPVEELFGTQRNPSTSRSSRLRITVCAPATGACDNRRTCPS